MIETTNLILGKNGTVSHLRAELEANQELFQRQPGIVQRFLESQAAQIASALVDNLPEVKFALPDRVVTEIPHIGEPVTITVPTELRQIHLGGLKNRFLGRNTREIFRQQLTALEQSPDQAVSTSAVLLRYALVIHLVEKMLPAGRQVHYLAVEGEEIPTIPEKSGELESAITQESDAIAEEGQSEAGRGSLQTPYVPAARRFYLPQWVAFGDQGELLTASQKEAEAYLASMQRYLEFLHLASSLATYIIANQQYQAKRYGMLGQLINQGRALAVYQTREIIAQVKERALKGNLNRGLSLSLPYFDDQELQMRVTNFEVIPAGRILFIPAFVVRAAREEAAKRDQDTRFNSSTRKYLLAELKMLEKAFEA
jgi:hypothetical protein